VPAGSEAPGRSRCEPHRELIVSKLDRGLSAQRVWQDLRTEHGIEVSYDSVKRFARRVANAPSGGSNARPAPKRSSTSARERRSWDQKGSRRRASIFRIALSHSRKGYTEATCRQTTDDLIRCLENAFHKFGGGRRRSSSTTRNRRCSGRGGAIPS
jgi:transposase